jgi:hypothetical protein
MKNSLRKVQWILMGLICFLCVRDNAWAVVELELPENMFAVAINGENTKIQEVVSLPDGVNQVVVQFQGLLARGHFDDDANMAYSDVFVIKFNATNQTLKMDIPRIKRSLDLEKFNRESNIRILDLTGRAIEYYIGKLEKDGFQLFREYGKELEDFNKTNSPAAFSMSRTFSKGVEARSTGNSNDQQTVSRATVSGTESIRQQHSDNMAEEMLKYWYQQADEATRIKFMRWINR